MQRNDSKTKMQYWYGIGQLCAEEHSRGRSWSQVLREQGEAHHYSRFSMQRFVDYTAAIDHLETIVPGLREEILAGKHRLAVDNTLILSGWEREAVLAALTQLADNNVRICDVFSRPNRNVRNKQNPQGGTVKDTPVYDPDAQVTGLIFTIPTWKETLERTALNTNYGTLSVEAYRKLLKALRELAACTNEFIQLMAEE